MRDFDRTGDGDLVVVLVGLTAGCRKRSRARRYFRQSFGEAVFLPWIPYIFGIAASAAWVSFRVRRRLARGRHPRLHLVAYIGGGVLVRLLHGRGDRWPIGRAVWDRSPAQEQVAGRLAARVPAGILTLLGHRSVVDLSRMDVSTLAFPDCRLGAGLIVESQASALARRLGIEEEPTGALTTQRLRALLPCATAAITVPLSHDEVYDDPRFLDEAAAFLRTGSFRASGALT
jgi:hypothetical protein